MKVRALEREKDGELFLNLKDLILFLYSELEVLEGEEKGIIKSLIRELNKYTESSG